MKSAINAQFISQLEPGSKVTLHRISPGYDNDKRELVFCEDGSWQDDAARFCGEPDILTVREAANIVRNSIFPAASFNVYPA